jgi:uncharacterized protein (TIGR02145 family)
MKIERIQIQKPFFIILASFLSIAACKKTENPVLPSVLIDPISALTDNSANCGGSLMDNSVSVASIQGVCWSTSENPTIADNKTSDSLGKFSRFKSMLNDLNPLTTYYIRAYVTVNNKTFYSEDQAFTTLNTVKDIEGNQYHSVKIGSQIWMKENLKAAKYQNGDDIATTDPVTLDITAENAPEYQWLIPENDNYLSDYGRLYTWYVAQDPRNVCPSGWHVPASDEWNTLIMSLYPAESGGGEMKETGTAHWYPPNDDATNSSGFTALPGGFRNESGYYGPPSYSGAWWSASSYDNLRGQCLLLQSNNPNVYADGGSEKTHGYSIRCIKDE